MINFETLLLIEKHRLLFGNITINLDTLLLTWIHIFSANSSLLQTQFAGFQVNDEVSTLKVMFPSHFASS